MHELSIIKKYRQDRPHSNSIPYTKISIYEPYVKGKYMTYFKGNLLCVLNSRGSNQTITIDE